MFQRKFFPVDLGDAIRANKFRVVHLMHKKLSPEWHQKVPDLPDMPTPDELGRFKEQLTTLLRTPSLALMGDVLLVQEMVSVLSLRDSWVTARCLARTVEHLQAEPLAPLPGGFYGQKI